MTSPGEGRITAPITESDASAGFRCGKRPLDDYFARHAIPNDRSGVSRAFVLRRAEEGGSDPPVLGYYTLSMALLESETAAAVVKAKLPRYPVPVALIGRFALDERVQGRGLGGALLADALGRVLALADQIGCLGVIVDAKDSDAERFYLKFGFTAFRGVDWPRRMFLPMVTVRAAAAE